MGEEKGEELAKRSLTPPANENGNTYSYTWSITPRKWNALMKAMHGNGARNDTEAHTKTMQGGQEETRTKRKCNRGARRRKRRRRRPAPRGCETWTRAEVAALPTRAKKRRVWAWKRHRRNGRRKERGKLDPDLAFYGVPAVQPIWSPLERADAQAQRLGMRPLIDEDLAHLGVPAAYTWHIPIAEWKYGMHS